MKILTAAEMGKADQCTAEEFNIPLASLMEQAGAAVARFCLRRYPLALAVTVLCGRGNNGGDGLVAARYLAAAGRRVHVLLTNQESEFKDESAMAMQRLRVDASSVVVETIAKESAEAQINAALASAELVVDALLGTGFKPPLRGRAVELRDKLADLSTPVVAVDLPSGWDADSLSLRAETAFRVDAVVTFTAPKLAHVFGSMTRGPVVVAPIGSPDAAIVSTNLPSALVLSMRIKAPSAMY
jgi:ADP-dependent NAD(P)H-hydrate dehydratase / NAD(P)H-hydrate epimerase